MRTESVADYVARHTCTTFFSSFPILLSENDGSEAEL